MHQTAIAWQEKGRPTRMLSVGNPTYPAATSRGNFSDVIKTKCYWKFTFFEGEIWWKSDVTGVTWECYPVAAQPAS